MRTLRSPMGMCVEYKNEWNSWRAMKQRCLYKKYHKYHLYGGRGITITPRWLGGNGFINFLADMGEKPTKAHSLDRINGGGHYEPTNCRWATQKEQMSHTTNSRMITLNGATATFAEQARKYGINVHTVVSRLNSGWDEKEAFTIPTRGVGANQTTYKEVVE